ncbi:MAG: hypothetical protein PHI84_11970 [Kiritimatiellae bacterium]|nr:hypothetical protein [Kiritimatiellia bacterium]
MKDILLSLFAVLVFTVSVTCEAQPAKFGDRGSISGPVPSSKERIAKLDRAQQLLSDATQIGVTNSLKLVIQAQMLCEQLLWHNERDDAFLQSILLMAKINYARGKKQEALRIVNNYQKSFKVATQSMARRGVPLDETPDYEASMFCGEVYETDGRVFLKQQKPTAAKQALTEAIRHFETAATIAASQKECSALNKVQELRKLMSEIESGKPK